MVYRDGWMNGQMDGLGIGWKWIKRWMDRGIEMDGWIERWIEMDG